VRQRGSTLVELLVAAAIAVLIAAAFWSLSQGARAFGVRSATTQFDAALAYAQTLAANSGNGATMVFERRVSADRSTVPGFVLTVYSGRPTSAGALRPSSLAPITSNGDISEAKLGSVPFTIFLNSAGHASGMRAAVMTGTVIATDPGCPAGENSVTLTLSDPRTSDTRAIPCNGAVAGSPVSIGTVAPESSAAISPTPAPTTNPTATPSPT
jgi:type II secretory pathway pseudopilin PulG